MSSNVPVSSSSHADRPPDQATTPSRFAPYVSMEFTGLKALQFPVARIKKIMKSDEDVSMISGEVPVLFSKACELFILDMTQQAYEHTLNCKRRTLQLNDIAAAVSQSSLFDFLLDVVQPIETEDGEHGEGEVTASNEPSLDFPVDIPRQEGNTERISPFNNAEPVLPVLPPPFAD